MSDMDAADPTRDAEPGREADALTLGLLAWMERVGAHHGKTRRDVLDAFSELTPEEQLPLYRLPPAQVPYLALVPREQRERLLEQWRGNDREQERRREPAAALRRARSVLTEHTTDPAAWPTLLTLYRRGGRKAAVGFLAAVMPEERVAYVISGLPAIPRLPLADGSNRSE